MNFWERLKEGVIIGDGAMGTQLYEKGISKEHCYDELNLSNPKIVQEIHRSYVDAGAEIIETNTFGANSYILGKYYDLAGKTKEINAKGVKIAKEACKVRSKGASMPRFVAGSIGPITRPYESKEQLSLSEKNEIFKEQISVLVEAGVDIIIFETMSDIEELIQGYKAAKDLCNLPIICQLTYHRDGKTLLGIDPVTATIKLKETGVSIMGANCGSGPQDVYEAVSRIGHTTDATLSAYPNAGLPRFLHGKFLYPASPEYFAEYAKKYVNIGVSIIGGCCGSTPEHIKAIANTVKYKTPKPRKIVQSVSSSVNSVGQTFLSVNNNTPKTSLLHPPLQSRTKLQEQLDKKFILSLEIDPPRGINFEKELNAAYHFESIGGDCVNISDNPMARLRMSGVSLASIIKQKTNLDVILHYTCRGRNLLTIQSDLLGVHALEIRNVLALTGDPPSIGDYPFASASYDVTSKELVEIIASLNRGVDWIGSPLLSATAFCVGIAGNLEEPEFTIEKIRKGANFIYTQPIFDLKKLENFTKTVHIPVVAGLLPLVSLKHAEFIRNEVPGITIPDTIIERIGKGAEDEGIKIAKELIQEMRKICNGVCIMPPFGRYEIVEKII